MKIKTLSRFLVPVVIAGVLSSCSTSNKVASSFGSRKYTKGFFFDRPTKPEAPAKNTASNKFGNAINTPIVTAKNTNDVSTSPVSIIEGQQSQTITNNKKVLFAKLAKTTNNSVTTVVGTDASGFPKATVTSPASNNSISNAASVAGGGGGGACKSWIAAVLLSFFLGGLGIHRFYLGYTWQGIVQLLTGGGCGIWALIDFIRILMKTLKPKNGDYCN